MEQDIKEYLIWLILIVLWNLGYPAAGPISDVIAAVLIPFIVRFILFILVVVGVIKKIKSK